MSKATKLIYIIFVTYLLISMNFSPRVNAQTTSPSPSQLSCQNIPKPSIVVYSKEPFKPKKDNVEKGNAFLVYAIKDLNEIKLEAKGLKDNNWQVIVTDPTKTNSIADRIPDTNTIFIKETGEYIIQTGGGDEQLELKAVDNSAMVNKVDNKRDLFIKIDSIKSKILQTQSYILGLLRKGYEADQIIYDALDKAIKDVQQNVPSPATGKASALSITGRQVDVGTTVQSVKNARIFLQKKGQVKIPLGTDFDPKVEVTCSSSGSTTKILSQTLSQNNVGFWSQVITKAQNIKEVVAEPVEKGVGYVEKGEKLFSAFKVTTISDDAVPQTFVVRVPNSDTAVGIDVINGIKVAQDYGVAPKLITKEPIPIKLLCKVSSATVEKSYKVLAEEFVEGEYAADALASGKYAKGEVYRAIGEADGKLWAGTETIVDGEQKARLPGGIDLNSIKVYKENGKLIARYVEVEGIETTDLGTRLGSIDGADRLTSYIEGVISKFDDEARLKSLLKSASERLMPSDVFRASIINNFLLQDLRPYLNKPSIVIDSKGRTITIPPEGMKIEATIKFDKDYQPKLELGKTYAGIEYDNGEPVRKALEYARTLRGNQPTVIAMGINDWLSARTVPASRENAQELRNPSSKLYDPQLADWVENSILGIRREDNKLSTIMSKTNKEGRFYCVCKDMSVLGAGMLQEAGVPAWLQRGINTHPSLPSPDPHIWIVFLNEYKNLVGLDISSRDNGKGIFSNTHPEIFNTFGAEVDIPKSFRTSERWFIVQPKFEDGVRYSGILEHTLPKAVTEETKVKLSIFPSIQEPFVGSFFTKIITELHGDDITFAPYKVASVDKVPTDIPVEIKLGDKIIQPLQLAEPVTLKSFATAFQKDVRDFIVSKGDLASTDDFLEQFPQYKSYNIEEIRQNLPESIELVTHPPIEGTTEYPNSISILQISKKAYSKFVYRGESGVGETNMIKLLEIFKKQGGIGSSSTYVATLPSIAAKYLSPDAGLWIIKSTAITELKAELDSARIEIAEIIPFKYVDRLLVTRDMRNAILGKYGADNTQLFGRPLKDVVMAGFDPDQPELLGRTVRELILQTPEGPKSVVQNPITTEDISAKAKELYEKRRRLYDIKVDDFSELSDEKLIEIIGGKDAVDNIVQDFGHASDYESYKQKNTGEARQFLLEHATYEHDQYGPFSTDAYLHGNGLKPVNEDAQSFDGRWGADAKKFLEDLSADHAKKELELQSQVKNFEGTRDLKALKQIRDQLAKEHRDLYKIESFVEKQERLVQSLYESTPLDFFEQRLKDLNDLYNHYVETFPTEPSGSRANVVLDQIGEFQSLLNDAKGRIQKSESLVEYHKKVVDLADRINANYEQLSEADKETFRPFVDLVEETVDSVDEDQIRSALNAVDEEKLKAVNKIAEETQKTIDKLPDDVRNSAPIKKAMSRYKELVKKTNGKFTKENYPPILNQLSMMKQMVSSTRNANINARNSLITKSAVKLKIPLFDRFKVEIEHRFTTNPIVSGANGYLETAKTFVKERQAVVDQTRRLISEEGFEGRFSRYGGTFSLGLVGVLSASPILKQYAQLSGNMYAYWAAVAIDGVSYSLIGATVVAELWLTLNALNIIKTGLPTALRFASISLQGFRAFGKATLLTIVITESVNIIVSSILVNVYESCSANKYYGNSQLVLEKNVVNPDDTIKFMVYGTQRCDISQLLLVKKTVSIEPDFTVASPDTKICAFDASGCCVGVSRVNAPPGTYTVKAISGGHTFLSESTDGQPFTVKGANDFVIFRSSMQYNSDNDRIEFSYVNNLDSDVLVLFYITDDKGKLAYATDKKGKLTDNGIRISFPLEKHTTSADLGSVRMELGLKGIVKKGNYVVAWAAYKTNDRKTPNLTPLDISYPNDALKIQIN